MTTITTPSGTVITPTLVLGYASGRESANIVHTIFGRSDPDVTFLPAPLRTGSLELLFATRATAWAALTAHAAAGSFRLADTDLPELNMRYVPTGQLSISLDPQTLVQWLVTVPYSEVIL
ncbi:hypothetical protein B0I08_101324 [Glaciihabitans tibetensis]|uniref:Uncharacterized protein n=1 Tax=Glaciihabitans tibetensis TaxID=1266600 RepID=A0A2T0VIZ3_9MICO|nr:hypothetical protein [Glaciihabitans tibetensis]PRY70196.1 hypothetical protein B0I08_101324 [Glaciihabitans tibetensis]